ncbi:uncharacterized protein N7459_005953 [Penicillium hispanicum]|uniref:uncharacterized protein n=1 Tax=Penicillium hispanicum TaxID=1080232 RepID=UPI0025412AC2|nr:uncharacterized protein N7459_005953 [Penicillium hispanicum]KAJ5579968.1 hypothetical protein N7459_005953 [Penicillium hispanicum]
MIAFSQKALAITVIIMDLSSAALACLELSGKTTYVDDGTSYILATETAGEVQTCYGPIKSRDKNLPCIDGYSLNYDLTDNYHSGHLPITYCNPENCFQGIEIPLNCDTTGDCTFMYHKFCH